MERLAGAWGMEWRSARAWQVSVMKREVNGAVDMLIITQAYLTDAVHPTGFW